MTESTADKTPSTAALSRELSEFLVEMSIGVHRYAMYPPSHPSLAPVVENIVRRLGELLAERGELSIGVAHRQLIIEGVATDQKHPVLSDLAARLHNHQLGACSFERGVTAPEVAGLLERLGEESERGGTPLGMLPPKEIPDWPHAHLLAVGYENVELHGTDDELALDRASALWLGLAQAALASDDPDSPKVHDVQSVAESISKPTREAAYDELIAGYLRELAEQLSGGRGPETDKIRKRVSELINALDQRTLKRLVEFGGNPVHRKQFLLDANQCLAVEAIIKVLHTAAQSGDHGISGSMNGLIDKLAVHASSGEGQQRSEADSALRENVGAVVEGWQLDDPEPKEHAMALDVMAGASPVLSGPETEEDSVSGVERVLQIALEADADGPLVHEAFSRILELEGAGPIVALLQEVPQDTGVAARILADLTTPDRFKALLAVGRIDDSALRVLVPHMGKNAIEPLLDVLTDSDDRSVRRRVFDALTDLDPSVGSRAIERLDDSRWFVLRNMLALLARLPKLPEDFDLKPYLEHPDHRVRREAFPVAMKRDGLRDRILVAALSDKDERMVRMGLLELQETVPEAVLPSLVNRVVMDDERGPEIRSFALKVLRNSKAPLALRTLLQLTTGGKTMLGRAKLAPKSPALLSALKSLAQTWPDHPETSELLDLAAKSKDPDIRDAVAVEPPGGGGGQAS